jgi:hypothetical protein
MIYQPNRVQFYQSPFPDPTTFEIEVGKGAVTGASWILKDGINFDVDTGSVPEDIWDGGGVYTGFPTGAAQQFVAVSTNAGDTGTLTFYYLEDANSTEYKTRTVTLNGTTPVLTGVSGIRCNYGFYQNGGATTFNLGDISLYHQVTTANVFFRMPIGYGQSYCSGVTIPKGNIGYIFSATSSIRGAGTTAQYADAIVWTRRFGGSPLLRNAYTLTNNTPFIEFLGYAFAIPENTDFIPRVLAVSTNNSIIQASYRLLLLKL